MFRLQDCFYAGSRQFFPLQWTFVVFFSILTKQIGVCFLQFCILHSGVCVQTMPAMVHENKTLNKIVEWKKLK